MQDKPENQLVSTLKIILTAKPDTSRPVQFVLQSDSTIGLRVKSVTKPSIGDTVRSYALKRGFDRVADVLDAYETKQAL